MAPSQTFTANNLRACLAQLIMFILHLFPPTPSLLSVLLLLLFLLLLPLPLFLLVLLLTLLLFLLLPPLLPLHILSSLPFPLNSLPLSLQANLQAAGGLHCIRRQ